jgi:hypothetical protein
MSMRHYRTISLAMGAGLAALLAGCSDPQSVDLRAQRQDSLNWTVDSLVKTEAGTNRSRGWALSQFRGQFEQDMENSSRNPGRLGAMIQNDFDRWKATQPLYNEAIQRELKGDPDNFRRTVPNLIW